MSRVDRALIKPRDVLVAVRGARLTAAVVPDDLDPSGAVATESVIILRFAAETVAMRGLVALLLGPGGEANELSGPSRTIGVGHSLAIGELKNWEVPVLPLKLQEEINIALEETGRAVAAAERVSAARARLLAALARELRPGGIAKRQVDAQ